MPYVVVVLEHESDHPGVEVAFGPYETREEADAAANVYAEQNALTRGIEVHVAYLHLPTGRPTPSDESDESDPVGPTLAVAGDQLGPRWFDVEVTVDGDQLRRYAVRARSKTEAVTRALSALPDADVQVHDLDFDTPHDVDFDAVLD